MDIDITWTDRGKDAARRNGITYREAIDVIDDARSVYLQYPDSIWVVGATASGLVLVTVVADRQSRSTSIYEISNVRPAGADETRIWEAKNR